MNSQNNQPNPGGLLATSGQSTWAGPIVLVGPTTIAANGTQTLQNGIATAQLTITGTITDVPGSATALQSHRRNSGNYHVHAVLRNGAGNTTPAITYTGIPSTDALAIQNALNALTTINSTGSVSLSPRPLLVSSRLLSTVRWP